MNTLELKGGIIEMIAAVQNEDILQQLYEVISEITSLKKDDVSSMNRQNAQSSTLIEVCLSDEELEQIDEKKDFMDSSGKAHHFYTPYETFGAAKQLDDLTSEQEAQLDADIAASYLPENLVEHELVIQKMSRWII